MPSLLLLDSSADLVSSRSRAITAAFADEWRSLGDDHTVVHRDLHRDQLPHLPDPSLHWPARLRAADATPPAEVEALQTELLDELIAADVLVIGVPLYNYSMPSTLKAWVDYIHVPGITAPFDVPSQPLAGRPAVLVGARGAVYDAGSPSEGWDHAIPPLTIILGTSLGMQVESITTSRTLAETVAAMAGEAERGAAELAAAKVAAAEAARRLG